MSTRRRTAFVVAAAAAALSVQLVSAAPAGACGLLDPGCSATPSSSAAPSGGVLSGLVGGVNDVVHNMEVDVAAPTLDLAGVGTVALPGASIGDGAATVTGPAVDVDAALLPGVSINGTTTTVALPTVELVDAPDGGLPGVQVGGTDLAVQLPAVSIATGSSPIDIPSINVQAGGVQATLPALGVTPAGNLDHLPGVSIGTGGLGVQLPNADVSGSLGPVAVPAISVEGGGAAIQTPSISTSPTGSLVELPGIDIGPGGIDVDLPDASVGSGAGPITLPDIDVTTPPIGIPTGPGGVLLPPVPGIPGGEPPEQPGNSQNAIGPTTPPSVAWTPVMPTDNSRSPAGSPAGPFPGFPTTPGGDRAGPAIPGDAGDPAGLPLDHGMTRIFEIPQNFGYSSTLGVYAADSPVGVPGNEPGATSIQRGPITLPFASAAGSFMALVSGAAGASGGTLGAPFVACLAAGILLAILGRQLLTLSPALLRPDSCSYVPLIPPA